MFCKNPDYEGQADEYDFYFVDKQNHCVRVMTPAGKVTLYADVRMGMELKDLMMEICVHRLVLIIQRALYTMK